MKMGNNKKGLGVCEVLTIILVVLKLAKVIDTSWWVVFLPITIPYIIPLLILIWLDIRDWWNDTFDY